MKKLCVYLPCYNEALNIGDLIIEWEQQRKKILDRGYKLFIVVIDDCSSDGTGTVVKKFLSDNEDVILITHQENKGLVGGLNTALSHFNEKGKTDDLMVLMDGDNTHSPEYVHSMIDKLEHDINCVIASRYCATSSIVGVQKHRVFLSDMARIYYRFILKVPNVEDYTCGYRLYTYTIIESLLERYGTDPIIEKSFACMMELLYKIYLVGGRFAEVPFELRYDNKKGESKMVVFKTMQKSISTAIKLRREKRYE